MEHNRRCRATESAFPTNFSCVTESSSAALYQKQRRGVRRALFRGLPFSNARGTGKLCMESHWNEERLKDCIGSIEIDKVIKCLRREDGGNQASECERQQKAAPNPDSFEATSAKEAMAKRAITSSCLCLFELPISVFERSQDILSSQVASIVAVGAFIRSVQILIPRDWNSHGCIWIVIEIYWCHCCALVSG